MPWKSRRGTDPILPTQGPLAPVTRVAFSAKVSCETNCAAFAKASSQPVPVALAASMLASVLCSSYHLYTYVTGTHLGLWHSQTRPMQDLELLGHLQTRRQAAPSRTEACLLSESS
jgi:hypothetical protein